MQGWLYSADKDMPQKLICLSRRSWVCEGKRCCHAGLTAVAIIAERESDLADRLRQKACYAKRDFRRYAYEQVAVTVTAAEAVLRSRSTTPAACLRNTVKLSYVHTTSQSPQAAHCS